MRLRLILNEGPEQFKAQLRNLLTKNIKDPAFAIYEKAGLGEKLLEDLINIDPTNNKSYLKKIAQWFNKGELRPLDQEYDKLKELELGGAEGGIPYDNRGPKMTVAPDAITHVEDYGQIKECLVYFDKYKARFKNAGLSADLNSYPTLQDALGASFKIRTAAEKTRDTGAENKIRGAVVVYNKPPYLLFMTPKLSIAERFGFTKEEAIKFLQDIGNKGAVWCTRGAYPGGSRAESYLSKDSVYTLLKDDVPLLQCNFVSGLEMQCVQNHNIPFDKIKDGKYECSRGSEKFDPIVKDILLEALSSKLVLTLRPEMTPEEQKAAKDDFYAKNLSNMAGLLKLSKPEDLRTNDYLNKAIKGYITHRRDIEILNMLQNYLRFICDELKKATGGANSPAEAMQVVSGTWLEQWANLFIKNPSFLMTLRSLYRFSMFNDTCLLEIIKNNPWALGRYYNQLKRSADIDIPPEHMQIINSSEKGIRALQGTE